MSCARSEDKNRMKTRRVHSGPYVDNPNCFFPGPYHNAARSIYTEQGLSWLHTHPLPKLAHAFAARVSLCCWIQTDPDGILFLPNRGIVEPIKMLPIDHPPDLNFPLVNVFRNCWGLPVYSAFVDAEVNMPLQFGVSHLRTGKN